MTAASSYDGRTCCEERETVLCLEGKRGSSKEGDWLYSGMSRVRCDYQLDAGGRSVSHSEDCRLRVMERAKTDS